MGERLFKFLMRRRFYFIIFMMILTLFFAHKAMNLRLYDDPNRWPPQHDPNVVLNDYIQDNFGGANVVIVEVMVKEGDIFNKDTLTKVERITQKVLLMEGVVFSYVASLNTLQVKYMKGTEDNLEIIPLMAKAPTTPEEMEKIKYGVYHNPTIYGSLVSPDAKATIIIADFRTGEKIPGVIVKVPQTDPVNIYKEIQTIIEPENDENTVVRCTGTPIIIGWVNSEGLPYILIAFGFFILVMALILYFAFRNIQGILIPIIIGLVGIIWGFGLQSLIQGEILHASSAFIAPFVVLAATACHSVQFLKRFFDEEYPGHGDAVSGLMVTVTALFLPMIISIVTDFGGFVVLSFVPFENVSVLGSIAAFGLISMLISFYLLGVPLISYFPGKAGVPFKEKGKVKGGGFMERAVNNSVKVLVEHNKAGWGIIGVVILVLVLSVMILPRLDPGQDNTYAVHNFLTRSWKGNPIYEMEMQVKEKFKGVYPLNILIETKEKGGLKDPEVLRKIDDFATFLQQGLPEVAGCLHLPLYIKLMHRFFHNEDDNYFKVPKEEKPIGEYLFMYSAGVPGSFDSVMDYDKQRTLLVVYVDSTSHEVVRRVLERAKNYARASFNDEEMMAKIGGGTIAITAAFNENITTWLILGTLLSALSSYLLVFIILRSLTAGIYILFPLFVGTIIWLGLIYIVGIEINSNTTSSLAVAMGMGIDAEIYFLYRFREEFSITKDFKLALVSAFTRIRKALIFSHFALIFACFSLIPIPLYVGYVGFGMGMIILICFFTSFIISPFLWGLLRPGFLFKKEPKT